MTEIYGFTQEYNKGDKVKVYVSRRKCEYGTIIDKMIKERIYDENIGKRCMREVLVLEKSTEVFNDEDCFFCLPIDKIVWQVVV